MIARERELHLLQAEKQKRDELERQLSEEIQMRERIVEENIKLRDKKPCTQVNDCDQQKHMLNV